MKHKRFFAFGCSFTRYLWPTWADILGRQYQEYYNYGQQGAGNMYIFNTVMEADQYHKFNCDDLIIVQWSCSSREDRYIKGLWNTSGGVVNFYNEQELERFFDFRGFVLRDLALIKGVKKLLEVTECEHYFISMVPLITNNILAEIFETNTQDVEQVYFEIVDFIKPSYEQVLGEKNRIIPKNLYGTMVNDNHPLPSEHYKYLKYTLPHLSTEPESVVIEIDKTLAEVYVSNFQDCNYHWPDIQKGILNIRERL
jgi:hypothetical protein